MVLGFFQFHIPIRRLAEDTSAAWTPSPPPALFFRKASSTATAETLVSVLAHTSQNFPFYSRAAEMPPNAKHSAYQHLARISNPCPLISRYDIHISIQPIRKANGNTPQKTFFLNLPFVLLKQKWCICKASSFQHSAMASISRPRAST